MSNIHKNFNSRTRVGATHIYSNYPQDMILQFTHPCGCDLHYMYYAKYGSDFNSRTRVGATA